MSFLERFVRVVIGIAVLLILWIGSAQLAVAVFGPQNNIIVACGMVGMFVGVWSALFISFPRLKRGKR